MDDITSLTKKINNKIKNDPIFFITNDAERALGLERQLDNYFIVAIDDNDIISFMVSQGINVFSLERKVGKQNFIYRNSNRLLQHKKTQEYILGHAKSGHLMFFKIAPNLFKTASDMGFDVLNTTSELNRLYELKLSQYQAIKDLKINLPKTRIIGLKDADYNELVKDLKQNFILQFNRGHTGGGTIVIDNKDRLEQLKSTFPQRTVRIAEQIYGNAYTINACITRYGICYGGLSYQITGIPELTSKKYGTVGNDWSFTEHLDESVQDKIYHSTKIIGEEMKKNGFKGMYGLDIVVDRKTNTPYIIEINARQPASISMFSKLQLLSNQIPLNMLAISEFLNIDYKIDPGKYNKDATKPIEAAQLFLRNKYENNAEIIGGVKPGMYRLVGDNSAFNWESGSPKKGGFSISLDKTEDKILLHSSDAYSIDDQKSTGLLILCTKEGKIVSPNYEVARIQSRQGVVDESRNLKPWVRDIITGFSKKIILKEIKDAR